MLITITTPPADRKASFAHKARHLLAVSREVAGAILFGPIRLHNDHKLRQTMAAMSDHELSDIGLIRQDVADTVALPFTSDAGSLLAARVSERRRLRLWL